MMYTWSRQRGPTSTASGIPAPMETGLAAGEDRPWTGDTLNGSANRGARGVARLNAQGGTDSKHRSPSSPMPRTQNSTRADRRAAPKWRQGILRPRDTDGRWPRSRRRWDAAKF